jgi:hypothetical protein
MFVMSLARPAAPEPDAAPPVVAAPAPEPVAPAVPDPEPNIPSATTTAPRPAARPTTSRPAATPRPETVAPVAAAPTTGTLRVEADVPDALVLFDRIGVGTAPVTIPDIAPGPHRLNVSAPGFDGYAETIDVEPGDRTIRIAFREIRLDATLTAVHKHGIGSCRGRLHATPQGIRYTAAEGNDSFVVTFADIERFEVDYLNKNLRLSIRGGRTYNFGDPDDNADRLFVFHRDVDKVRQRVVGGE